MTYPRICLVVLALVLSLGSLCAQEEPPVSYADRLREAGVGVTSGPATVPLGRVAELKLPEGYLAIEAASLEKFYALTENIYSGEEVGVVIAPTGWMLFFDFEGVGYVKDDDKDQLDADALMKTMEQGQAEANKQRAEQGWDQMRFAGWAEKPHYDSKTNHLKWALRLTSSSDNYQAAWINENIRLLGRSGVMNVTLVTDPDTFAADSATAQDFLTGQFSYVAGQRYSEFRAGDKVAEYGLTALVVGGAGALAYKAGFLQKFWKLIVGALLVLGAGAKKVWMRLTGSQPV